MNLKKTYVEKYGYERVVTDRNSPLTYLELDFLKLADGQSYTVDEKGKDDFMSDWKILSNDGKINLTFKPIIDRADNTDFGILASNQHQVFGGFYGDLVLDDGSTITLDGQIGFAEKVANKW